MKYYRISEADLRVMLNVIHESMKQSLVDAISLCDIPEEKDKLIEEYRSYNTWKVEDALKRYDEVH